MKKTNTKKTKARKPKFKEGGRASLLRLVEILYAPKRETSFGFEYYVEETSGERRWVWEYELNQIPGREEE